MHARCCPRNSHCVIVPWRRGERRQWQGRGRTEAKASGAGSPENKMLRRLLYSVLINDVRCYIPLPIRSFFIDSHSASALAQICNLLLSHSRSMALALVFHICLPALALITVAPMGLFRALDPALLTSLSLHCSPALPIFCSCSQV